MISSRNNNFSNRGQKLIIRVNRAPAIPDNNGDNNGDSSNNAITGSSGSSRKTNKIYIAVVLTIMISIIIGGTYLYGKKQGDGYWSNQVTWCRRSCQSRV